MAGRFLCAEDRGIGGIAGDSPLRVCHGEARGWQEVCSYDVYCCMLVVLVEVLVVLVV